MELTVAQMQDRIRQRYLERDAERGMEGTFMWLVEEVGELSTALRGKSGDVADELADVIAWTVSVANLAGIDVTAAFNAKYPDPEGA